MKLVYRDFQQTAVFPYSKLAIVDRANHRHVSTVQTIDMCRPCKHLTRVDPANPRHVSTVHTLDMC